jgi:hypothetical protein
MSELELTSERLKELRELEKANDGILKPEDVVDRAKNPKSALHGAFTWDDTEAAKQYRLEQARRLIRVTVEYIPAADTEMRAYVSVRSDRNDEGGYRHFPTLMRSENGRKSVLETALWELENFQRKYSQIKELVEVFESIRRVRKAA